MTMTSSLDIAAIRACAERAMCGAVERQEWAKAAMPEVVALCDRVAGLEAALRMAECTLCDAKLAFCDAAIGARAVLGEPS